MHFHKDEQALTAREDELAELRLRAALSAAGHGAERSDEQVLRIASGSEADEAFQRETDEVAARCREFLGRFQKWLTSSDAGVNGLISLTRVQMISQVLADADQGRSEPGELAGLWARVRTEALS